MPVTKGTNTDDYYPDRWLKGDDLPEEGQYLRISDVNAEEVGDKRTLVVTYTPAIQPIVSHG